MKTYAQNREDLIVHSYLRRKGITSGSVLDIGANDGITFSNSRYFFEQGYDVYFVEPSPKAIERLKANYEGGMYYGPYQYAVGTEPGKMKFFESGSLLRKNDVALVSTFDEQEKQRWPMMEYTETVVDVITFEKLISLIGVNSFTFISVDAEGFDLKILKQIDFNKIGCDVVCVEWNGMREDLYWSHVKQFGFKLIAKNGENLIYGR